MKTTIHTLKQKKQNKEKIVCLTAYDYYIASLLDEAGYDLILVGDSLGMVFYGYETTLPVTVDEMLYHTKAVSGAAKNALVVADMPFLSYQASKEDAIRNAGRFLKEANANAVKLEGGSEMCDTIKAVIDAGIPVLGHIGLMPQSVHKLGGYKMQGKDKKGAEKLINDAIALDNAGCFGVVLECIPEELARDITEKISIPTIGIGAGQYCDGQILVVNDMLGYNSKKAPKFAKRYADVDGIFKKAFEEYKKEVQR